MKVVIIDNDREVVDGLMLMLNEFCPQITDLNYANTIEKGIECISKFNPDLVFLDVELDQGTGMDLLTKLKQYTFEVIFITAYNKYAVDAFRFSAIDFLLKPIGLEDLLAALERAKLHMKNKDLSKQLLVLKENLNSLTASEKKIVLKDSDSVYFLKISDIILCKAEGSYTIFYLENKQKITVSKGLREYDELLVPNGFIRTHHSYLVNIKKITRFAKDKGGLLILQNGEEVPVSQRKREQILNFLSNP